MDFWGQECAKISAAKQLDDLTCAQKLKDEGGKMNQELAKEIRMEEAQTRREESYTQWKRDNQPYLMKEFCNLNPDFEDFCKDEFKRTEG